MLIICVCCGIQNHLTIPEGDGNGGSGASLRSMCSLVVLLTGERGMGLGGATGAAMVGMGPGEAVRCAGCGLGGRPDAVGDGALCVCVC